MKERFRKRRNELMCNVILKKLTCGRMSGALYCPEGAIRTEARRTRAKTKFKMACIQEDLRQPKTLTEKNGSKDSTASIGIYHVAETARRGSENVFCHHLLLGGERPRRGRR